jgi:hypothetical protein
MDRWMDGRNCNDNERESEIPSLFFTAQNGEYCIGGGGDASLLARFAVIGGFFSRC